MTSSFFDFPAMYFTNTFATYCDALLHICSVIHSLPHALKKGCENCKKELKLLCWTSCDNTIFNCVITHQLHQLIKNIYINCIKYSNTNWSII